jgi:subtilisin family serine protease
MRKTLQVSVLASMIGVSLLGGASVSTVTAAELSQVVNGVSTYLIEFQDAGALHYTGGMAQFRGTAPDPLGIGRFDAASQEVQAYRSFLRQQQQSQLHEIASVLGHDVEVTHTYEITHSGVAALLSAEEAGKIARLPGVKSVKADRIYQTDTYRGPAFIGAETIWNAPLPGGSTNRGKGVVVGVLDSGSNSTHPSFANDASCGFSAADKKLLSFVDCSATSAGVCAGPTPEAVDSGHGVHTSSTAAGNTVTNAATPSPMLPSPYTQMSGVAPCASIRSYKVCPGTTCPGSDISAGINSAIADGVNVINFSISGGTSPWSDNDRQFLDAVNANIFVAASAGNTSATITNPVGQVNHRGPWMMTVAASTQDMNIGPGLSATGPGTVPAGAQNLLTALGSHISAPAPFTNVPIRVSTTNALGCTASGAFPANYFSGSVALIQRGTCNFTEKVANAAAAGAQAVFIWNNTFGTINMNTDGATIPAYSITQAAGTALNSFIAANGATPTTSSLSAAIVGGVQGDVLGDFSFRGPTPGVLADLTKPDITAPGVNILAAGRVADGNYYVESGTSMSGPHVAGAAALVRAVRPSWTPAEVKSALQMTAKRGGFKENGTDPWNVDDVGSGRVDLSKASAAGLVMNETYANYLAANPSGGTINIKALNIPSVRNMACNGSCTFTRTLTSKLATSSTWTATYVGDPAINATVSPSTFTVAANGTQAITITALVGTTLAAPTFGYVVLTPSDSAQSPVEHITVAVKGQGVVDKIFADGFDTVTPPSMACLSANGKTSTGALFSGNANNSVVTLNIGAGNEMTGAAADVSLEALSPSWLSETQVTFSGSSSTSYAINLTMSDTDDVGVETNSSTEGVLLFSDFGLGNVVPDADGILRLEWNETYTDAVVPNARWSNSTSPFTCAGIRIICTNQAACDAAVNAAGN